MNQISAEPDTGISPFQGSTPKSWFGLVVLVLIGLYLFLDRQVITLQVEQVTEALSLSDFQFGLIQGFSIALFAAVVGYPIAWLADRVDRRYVLAGSILVWSVAVAACGLAQDFTQLFFASAVVGAGEAALLPIAYALIPELFRGRSRFTANSTLILATRIGSGVVMALCGLLVAFANDIGPSLPGALGELEPWRLSLLMTALPGPLFALLALVLPINQEPKPEIDALDTPDLEPDSRALVFLGQNIPTFVAFYIGIGFTVFGLSASGAFLPVVAIREMNATPVEVGAGFGGATLIATLLSMVIVVALSTVLTKRLGDRAPIWLLMLSAIAATITAPLFLLAATPTQIFLLVGLHFTFTLSGMMAFPTAIQDMCPTPSRARLIAIIIIINLAMSAASPPLVGLLSDLFAEDGSALIYAIVLTATIAFAISSIAFFFCSLRFVKTVRAAREIDGELGTNSEEGLIPT